MLKIRITYNREKEFDIINQSPEYKNRGKSKYSNIYLDVESK